MARLFLKIFFYAHGNWVAESCADYSIQREVLSGLHAWNKVTQVPGPMTSIHPRDCGGRSKNIRSNTARAYTVLPVLNLSGYRTGITLHNMIHSCRNKTMRRGCERPGRKGRLPGISRSQIVNVEIVNRTLTSARDSDSDYEELEGSY